MAIIHAYQNQVGGVLLVSGNSLMTKLPSGEVFKAHATRQDIELTFHRMHLEFIGDAYAEFNTDNYDSIIEQLWGDYGTDDDHPFHNRKTE